MEAASFAGAGPGSCTAADCSSRSPSCWAGVAASVAVDGACAFAAGAPAGSWTWATPEPVPTPWTPCTGSPGARPVPLRNCPGTGQNWRQASLAAAAAAAAVVRENEEFEVAAAAAGDAIQLLPLRQPSQLPLLIHH